MMHTGSKSYRAGMDTSDETSYRDLEATRSVTTTSLPSLASLEEAYRRITAEGNDIVSVHMSSKISGTYNTALMASTADGVADSSIVVVDTCTISMAEGWVVIRAAQAAREGKARDEI